MEKELTLEEQLEIVREVKQAFISAHINNKGPGGLCMCFLISLAGRGHLLRSLYDSLFVNFTPIVNFIPIFTNTNAVKYADARPIEDPHSAGYFWWDLYNYSERLKFLNWMEEELLKLTEAYK